MKLRSSYEILDRFLNEGVISHGEKPLKMFFGETVDEFGMPIDSLKYYFALSLMAKRIRSIATVVIADVASFLNDSTRQKKDAIRQSMERRIALLQKIITVYQLPITIRLMSEIFETQEYKTMRDRVAHADLTSIEPFLVKTVLVNALDEEKKKGFRYALDAIATGLLYDVKIGPPRERFYDEAGEKILSKKFKSVYLTPTYPLGKNFAFFLTHPEIEEFGLTPYKAGSNKLQDFRIILGETPLDRAVELVRTSFESFEHTAHPVLDLFEITQMAGELLTGLKQDKKFNSIDDLKESTILQVRENIYKPLELL